MTEAEQRVYDDAVAYAPSIKKRVVQELCDLSKYPAELNPVSVFMAGSPGAGKTESATNLISRLSPNNAIIHIDADEMRRYFPEYTGTNSYLFQGGVSILVDAVHDCALKNNQSFVFDGTLTKLEKTRLNIGRSLKRGRFVQLLYVYQDPFQAWEFVQERERKEGRNIPRDTFIEQYFTARVNVNQLKAEFDKRIKVDLIVKNIDGTNFAYYDNIDQIDRYLSEKYTKEQLQQRLPA